MKTRAGKFSVTSFCVLKALRLLHPRRISAHRISDSVKRNCVARGEGDELHVFGEQDGLIGGTEKVTPGFALSHPIVSFPL